MRAKIVQGYELTIFKGDSNPVKLELDFEIVEEITYNDNGYQVFKKYRNYNSINRVWLQMFGIDNIDITAPFLAKIKEEKDFSNEIICWIEDELAKQDCKNFEDFPAK